jgi:hypothetical protein
MNRFYGSYSLQPTCEPDDIRYVKKKLKMQGMSLKFSCNSRNYASTDSTHLYRHIAHEIFHLPFSRPANLLSPKKASTHRHLKQEVNLGVHELPYILESNLHLVFAALYCSYGTYTGSIIWPNSYSRSRI